MKFLFIFALLISGSAMAQKGMQTGPCAQDAKTFCKGIKPGEGRVKACLKQNKAKLSPACKNRIKNRLKNKMNKRAKNCAGDVKRFCKGIKPGEGRIRGCLKAHKNKLSGQCANSFNRAKKGKGKKGKNKGMGNGQKMNQQ